MAESNKEMLVALVGMDRIDCIDKLKPKARQELQYHDDISKNQVESTQVMMTYQRIKLNPRKN